MTTVSLKLVGNTNNVIVHSNEDSITISDILNYLMMKGLSFDEISKIKFINKGNDITDDMETNYIGTDEDPVVIHMFTQYQDVKDEIIKCVYSSSKNNYYDNQSSDNHSDDNHSDDNHSDDNLSQEEISKNNLKTIELFSDKEFTYLLNICLNKPELLNKVSSYITNGDISVEIKDINKEQFKYEKEKQELETILNKLNIININTMPILQHFDGNLNLSLRHILISSL
jgi:hypothetical protein